VPVATAKQVAITAPLASGPLDAQIWPARMARRSSSSTVTLDPKVKLPARVRIPVPKNAVVEWAGEILSGDASTDQQRTFTLHDGRAAVMPSSRSPSRTAVQIETNASR